MESHHPEAQRYRDEILVAVAVPLLRQIGPQALLQDDNAHLHRARLVDNFLHQVGSPGGGSAEPLP